MLSNQRCHDITVSTVFQRNSTDLASARTTKRTSSLRTDVQISKKGALSLCMCTGQVCAEHRHLHYSFVTAARAPAWTSHQGFHGNEHLALTKSWRNSRLGLCIVVPRDVGLLEQKRNELPVWLGGFLFLRQHFKICSCSSFQNCFLFQLEKDSSACAECRKKNFLLRAGRFCTFFQVFFSQGGNPKISLLQKVEEMAPFACKKTV